MRWVLIGLFCAACGGKDRDEPVQPPAPELEVRRLAAPCLSRAGGAEIGVVAVLGEDRAPAVVNVTGTRDGLVRGCVAKAVKSVVFGDRQPGDRVELALGSAPNAAE